jgi:hypothetical protein
VVTIDVERAFAKVQTSAPPARPEEWAVLEMPPIWIQFAVVHGVNITSTQAESMD